MKEKTIKYLEWQISEIQNNLLGMEMTAFDYKENEKEIEAIKKCIKWVKSK